MNPKNTAKSDGASTRSAPEQNAAAPSCLRRESTLSASGAQRDNPARERTLRRIEQSRESRRYVRLREHRRDKHHYRGRLGELLKELRTLLFHHGNESAYNERVVSAKTRRDRRLVMRGMLIALHRSEFKLCHLKNFRGKHVLAIIRHWTELGIMASTMATYVAHLRTFVRWIDKPDLMLVIDRYCAERPELTRRQTATDTDKSERAVCIDAAEIIRRAEQIGDEHFLCQMLLITSLGLRVREAWLFRPHLAGVSGHLHIAWGTKGGRPRTLPAPVTPEQASVLERARALVEFAAGSMIPPQYQRVDQWARRFYRLCRKIGLTRSGLGITPHSLRHGVLLDLFEQVAGEPAPVRGAGERTLDPGEERAAREIVAQAAGHSRVSVTSAYLGSSRALGKAVADGAADAGALNSEDTSTSTDRDGSAPAADKA